MRLRDINKKEFEDFCVKNELDNFFQSKYYAEIKRKEGYHTYFVGLDQNGSIIAATMLLSKNISLFKKRMFYAPRGFIIDYKNQELLETFSKLVIEYVKNKKGVYLKINPYLTLHDRNYEGEIIEGGLDNTNILEKLKSIGFRQDNYELLYPIEEKYLYKLNLKNKSEDELFNNFSDTFKNNISRNEAIGISVKKLDKDNIDSFINILENSSNTSNYINIDSNNYKDIINILDNHNLLDINVVELDIDKYLESTINSKENEDDSSKEEIDKQIESIKDLQYKYGHKVFIGASLAVSYHNEYLVLVHSINDKFKNFDPLTTLYWETIKSSKKLGNEVYNFYGIGNSLEDNERLDIYKNYNGKVVELIGEFDYVINDYFYKKQRKKEIQRRKYKKA